MKTFKLHKSEDFDDRGVLRALLGSAVINGGFTVAKMRSYQKILDKLDACGDELELEDAEYADMKGRIQQQDGHWVQTSRHLLDFLDRIEAAEKPPDKSSPEPANPPAS